MSGLSREETRMMKNQQQEKHEPEKESNCVVVGYGGSPVKRCPVDKPPFSLADLKRAIPPHCFTRSLSRSLFHLAIDLLAVCLLLYSIRFFSHPAIPPLVSSLLLWPAYWIAQGCVSTGIWVLAHECGHGAFSDYPFINDTVGLLFHSVLLVPYFSWKFSHRRHHSNTGSIERDEVFVPKLYGDLPEFSKKMANPLGRVMYMVVTLTAGWPLYLSFNATGRPYDGHHWLTINHFNPFSPIFNARERVQVVISDLALAAVCGSLCAIGSTYGFMWLFFVYGIPLLIVNGWLVLITLLQHTHPALPHYSGSEWNWLRGALATVDRDYGKILNSVFHHIADTHVVHHLFSTMPFYHALEATRWVKPVLGDYYKEDNTPISVAFWREFRDCLYVHPDDDDGTKDSKNAVLWYNNKLSSPCS